MITLFLSINRWTEQLKSVLLQSGGVNGGAQEQAQDVQLAAVVDAVVQVSVHWTEALAKKSVLNAHSLLRNLGCCYTNHCDQTQLVDELKY